MMQVRFTRKIIFELDPVESLHIFLIIDLNKGVQFTIGNIL